MSENTGTPVNDVNLAAVGSLVAQIQKDPRAASTRWKTEVRWKGAFRSEARTRDLPAVPSDEPATLGGSDEAPNPVEQLLAALGNCLAVGYAANASVAGIAIRNLKIDLEGDIDLRTFLGLGEGNAGFDSIRAIVHLDSDSTPDQLAQLHRKVVGTSPVGHTLSRSVPLRIELG
jgi:uncharacterized OsmC-like protein